VAETIDSTPSERAVGDRTAQAASIPAASSNPEKPKPMHEVHAPHQTIHSWKDFLVHIAAIAMGLLMAIGLEQTVEHFHHQHQAELIEEQMHSVLQSNIATDADTLKRLDEARNYLAGLQVAIANKLQGLPPTGVQPVDYRRLRMFVILPGLAPFDAAKANGTVAWLPVNRIRIYTRVVLARDLVSTMRDRWSQGLAALEEFQEQFVDSTGTIETGSVSEAPDLGRLTKPQLEEYLKLVAALIKRNDSFTHRLEILDFEFKQVVDGVADEDALVQAMLGKFWSAQASAEPAIHR
jgi:hypothetical protein